VTRVGVLSDSHGDHEAIDELLERMGYLDAVCFLGDVARDAYHIGDRLLQMPGSPRPYSVRGNNDWGSILPLDQLIELGGVRIYMTHGHMIASVLSLCYRAKEMGADIALFGHTHQPFCERMDGVLLVNPGSAGNHCRGGRARASVLEIERGNVRVLDVCL